MRTSARQKQKDNTHNSSRSGYVYSSHKEKGEVTDKYNNNSTSAGCSKKKGSAAASPSPSLPYGLDCSGGGDCSCSSLRHRLLASPAPSPAPTPASRRAARALAARARTPPGHDVADTTDVDWRIPYPGRAVFPSSPTALLEEPDPRRDARAEHRGGGGERAAGGGGSDGAVRSGRHTRTVRWALLALAGCAALLLVASALLVLWREWAAGRAALPASRQLPAPAPALPRADARLALRPDAAAAATAAAVAPSALDQLRAELRLVRTELRRVRERAVETTVALGARLERQMAEARERPEAEARDREPMPDFALESAGGAILATPDTSPYATDAWETLWGVPLWPVEKSPRNIIQPSLEPGACWAFRGAEGRVAVALAMPARLTHVTLEHIPAGAALTGSRASAPRRCSLTGLETTQDTSGPQLGQFTYTLDGPPRQTFVLSNALDYPFRAVLLHIHNNHGNPEYTCVYRFRVHGNVISEQTKQQSTGT